MVKCPCRLKKKAKLYNFLLQILYTSFEEEKSRNFGVKWHRGISERSPLEYFEFSSYLFSMWRGRGIQDPYIIISQENFIYRPRSNMKYGPTKTGHSYYTKF